jgi:hypothetical protein
MTIWYWLGVAACVVAVGIWPNRIEPRVAIAGLTLIILVNLAHAAPIPSVLIVGAFLAFEIWRLRRRREKKDSAARRTR